jgi:hypothetical protein
MPLPPLPHAYSVRGLEPPAVPPEWGPPPGVAQVKDAIYRVLAAHGRLSPDTGDPDPDHVGLMRSWAQEVLICGLGADDAVTKAIEDNFELEEDGSGNVLASQGYVWFDAERIYGEGDYAATVALLAAATGGDWQPGRLRSAYAGGPDTTVIEFEHRGQPERWTIKNTESRYVRAELYTHAELFAEASLPGRFVYLPTGTEESWLAYLPAGLAGDLRLALRWPSPEALLASVRAALAADPAPLVRALGDVAGWLGTWPDVSATAGGGSSLREAVLAGHAGMADRLLRLGADPRDATGLASDPALRDMLEEAAAARIGTLSRLLVERI